MLPTVYVETTIVSYLTAKARNELIYAARQELTRLWWEQHRSRYDLVTSELVLEEARRGDPEAAVERLNILREIDLLSISDPRIQQLSQALLDKSLLPEKARADSLHLATATVHQVNYRMTWNCRHIANADLLPRVYQLMINQGYTPPLVVTPEEFSSHE